MSGKEGVDGKGVRKSYQRGRKDGGEGRMEGRLLQRQ